MASHSENIAHTTLVNCHVELVREIAQDPHTMANHLYQHGVIAQAICDEVYQLPETKNNKARKLVDALESKVENYPEHFQKFLAILRKRDLRSHYADLLKSLNDKYSELGGQEMVFNEDEVSPEAKDSDDRVTYNPLEHPLDEAEDKEDIKTTRFVHQTKSNVMQAQTQPIIMAESLSIDDLQDVLDATIDVKHLWLKMGLALRLRQPVLDGFATKHHNDPDDCYHEVLKEWLNNVPNPSWEKLVKALQSDCVRHSNIADKIAKDHCPHMQKPVAVAVCPMLATSLPSMSINTVENSASQTPLSRSLHQVAEWLANQNLDVEPSLITEGFHSQCCNVTPETESTIDTYETAASRVKTGHPRHKGQPLKLEWKFGKEALQKMNSPIDAVIYNNIAYFRPRLEEDILTYCSTSGEWAKLTTCNVKDTSLAIVRGTLVTVGGIKSETERVNKRDVRTNDLYSFTSEGWEKILPSMSMKRSQVTTVSNEAVLIVAGGRDDSGPLTTVEVLNLDTKVWSFAKNLPQPVFRASSCICGDYLYVVGGERDKDKLVRSAYRASLSDLLQSSDSTSIQGDDGEPAFCSLEKLPAKNPACVTICGQLLAIGGLQSNGYQLIPSKFVYRYDPNSDCWQKLDNPMNTPRNRCFAVALSESRLMVVGGYTVQADVGCTDIVEFANVTV